MQQSGADPVGQVLQDGVVALVAERHAHQPDGRRGDQQRADRGVDRPIGDVEEVVVFSGGRQTGVQAGEVVIVDRIRRGEVNGGHQRTPL